MYVSLAAATAYSFTILWIWRKLQGNKTILDSLTKEVPIPLLYMQPFDANVDIITTGICPTDHAPA